MSRSIGYSYSLEARARQALYNQRAGEAAEKYYRKYSEQFKEMQERGFSYYMPEEMKRLEADLDRINLLLINNPVQARDLTFTVGSSIKSIYALAETAAKTFERNKRIRREQLNREKEKHQSEMTELYYTETAKITNPIVINFAQTALQQILNEIENKASYTEETLKERINGIVREAEQKAESWKQETASAQRAQVVKEKIEEAENRISGENIENTEKAREFKNRLSRLKEGLSISGADLAQTEKELKDIDNEAEDTLITEEVRRETVKAIIKQLNTQGFNVSSPKRINNDSRDYVKITAKKPSGKRAVCNVDMKGQIVYKFDNYEGMTCLKDMERFKADLKDIYSVKLSDERILWSNPDRLSADERSLPKSQGRNA